MRGNRGEATSQKGACQQQDWRNGWISGGNRRARTRRSEMKNVAVSLTYPHVSERCAHHGCCRKGSCRSAWLPLTKRLRRDQSNGGVLNGIFKEVAQSLRFKTKALLVT